MGPKELAKLYEKKIAATTAEAGEKKAQIDAQQAEFRKRAEQGRAAMRDVVIPYFKELVSTFPKGAFKFNPSLMIEVEGRAPLAASFKIGDGAEHVIEVQQGNVKIYRKGPQAPQQAGPAGVNINFVYSGEAEPFIAGPSDLTPEKLSKLVEMAIKET